MKYPFIGGIIIASLFIATGAVIMSEYDKPADTSFDSASDYSMAALQVVTRDTIDACYGRDEATFIGKLAEEQAWVNRLSDAKIREAYSFWIDVKKRNSDICGPFNHQARIDNIAHRLPSRRNPNIMLSGEGNVFRGPSNAWTGTSMLPPPNSLFTNYARTPASILDNSTSTTVDISAGNSTATSLGDAPPIIGSITTTMVPDNVGRNMTALGHNYSGTADITRISQTPRSIVLMNIMRLTDDGSITMLPGFTTNQEAAKKFVEALRNVWPAKACKKEETK